MHPHLKNKLGLWGALLADLPEVEGGDKPGDCVLLLLPLAGRVIEASREVGGVLSEESLRSRSRLWWSKRSLLRLTGTGGGREGLVLATN